MAHHGKTAVAVQQATTSMVVIGAEEGKKETGSEGQQPSSSRVQFQIWRVFPTTETK